MKNKKSIEFDAIVIGCGFAGAVIARELAQRAGKQVLVLEKRLHIGGNAYDCANEDRIFIHQYGPHIFHTNEQRVFSYLSQFTTWREYSHEVVANLEGVLIPVPFNLNSLHAVFNEGKAQRLQEKLLAIYGYDCRVTLAQLRSEQDPELLELASFVYEKIFSIYTKKQWGQNPDEIDPAVIARVPILISHDNRYFQDKYQGVPAHGYAALFANMLDYSGIKVQLGVDAHERIMINDSCVLLDGLPFTGEVIYTGALDELFDCCYGRLPYRTLDFAFETHQMQWFQSKGTVNYTVSEEFTRITEFKYLTGQHCKDKTTIVKEFAREYGGKAGEIPYYAVANPSSNKLYEQYYALTKSIAHFHILGRLAEFKYYNMDVITLKALQLADRIIEKCEENK